MISPFGFVAFALLVPALAAVGFFAARWINRHEGKLWAKIGAWTILVVLLLFMGTLGQSALGAYHLLPSILIIKLPLIGAGIVIWYIRAGRGVRQTIRRSFIGLLAVASVFCLTVVVNYYWPSEFPVFRSKLMLYLMTNQPARFGDETPVLLQVAGKRTGNQIALFPTSKPEKFVGVIEPSLVSPGTLRDGVVQYDERIPGQRITLWWLLAETYTVSEPVP